MKFENIEVGASDCISIPIPESYKDCFCLINSDAYRVSGKKRSYLKILMHILSHPLSPIIWLRLCAYKGWLFYFTKLMFKISSLIYLIDIPSGTKIGYGFFTGHQKCIVVNGKTIIGNNVNLSHFVNIGSNHNTPAIIGDNVYIGPSVCIVEAVRIGSNSTIGAGAVVTKDVPLNSTCAGVPAKVINFNNPGRYVGSRWKWE